MKREIQKQEALARMRMLKLNENIIKEFEAEEIINLSENGGFLYWLSDEQKQLVEDFESEHNALVYHVIHSYTNIGEMLTLLYVSKYKDEWKDDRADIQNGCVLAYVINLDDDTCSEFGSVGIQPQIGGLKRIY